MPLSLQAVTSILSRVPPGLCILLLLFGKLCFANNDNGDLNFERRSPGAWYGDANLIGEVNRDGFTRAPYSKWFVSEYDSYRPNKNIVSYLAKDRGKELDDLQVTVFMGTWCSDSKMQVPRLYKFLDQAGFDESQLSVHAVDIKPEAFRRTPNGLAEQGMNIYRVPTIIVHRNDEELGRIVEAPLTTLELDFMNIIKEETGVKTRYPLEGLVNHYLEKYGLAGFEDQIEAIATELKSKGIKEDELNHYIAYNLIYSRRYREAELVTRVMLTLFPEAGHLHMILARVYEALNRNEQALESYRKAFVYVNEKGKLDIIRDAISRSQGFK